MKVRFDLKGLPDDAELSRMFNAVPQLERFKVSDSTVRAGGKVVMSAARRLAPRDTKGHKHKRSAKQQAAADWDYPLWKTIKQVVRRYAANAAAIIGPEWPRGNKSYFDTSPGGRTRVLWGHRPTPASGLSSVKPTIRNWIVQSFDETRPQQLAAMKAMLTKKMRDIWE